MDWKSIIKPIVKYCLKLGHNTLAERAAAKVKEHPDKGGQISGDVANAGDIVSETAKAVENGSFDKDEKDSINQKIDAFVDAIFAY